MIAETSGRGMATLEDCGSLQCWEFHDLLFHARSRMGRHDYPVGGIYRFVGQSAPPAALKARTPVELIDLYRPDLDALERDDPPYARVQETRRSIRQYSDKALSARQLGEFLYRVARVADYEKVRAVTSHGVVEMEIVYRPYPGGGALYELDLYLVVNNCESLAPGLYYYDPEHHRLDRLTGRTADTDELLNHAGHAAGITPATLQVLIIVAARFERVAWKYSSISYSVILKNVGVLFQTMYLAATAMGLAPCALGCGDSDLFARAAGTNYLVETSVGEFLLGSKR